MQRQPAWGSTSVSWEREEGRELGQSLACVSSGQEGGQVTFIMRTRCVCSVIHCVHYLALGDWPGVRGGGWVWALDRSVCM